MSHLIGTDLLRHVLMLDVDERESGFSQIVNGLSRRGLAVAGALGIAVNIFYLFMHIVVMGYEPQLVYDAAHPDAVVMWDKLLYLAISVIGFAFSRTRYAETRGRLILGLLVFLAAIAMLVDDLASDQQSVYAVGYLTIIMFLAVGAMPFKPVHILVMCTGILLAMVLGPDLIEQLSVSETTLLRRATYWTVASALLVGISSLVYRSRYDQFVARQAIEAAEQQIRDHARSLETKTVALAAAIETTEEQAEQLRRLERLKSKFFASISQEFRTPITLILGPAKDEIDREGENLPESTLASLNLIERSQG